MNTTEQKILQITMKSISVAKTENGVFNTKFAPLDEVVKALAEPLKEQKLAYRFEVQDVKNNSVRKKVSASDGASSEEDRFATTGLLLLHVYDVESDKAYPVSFAYPIMHSDTMFDFAGHITYGKRYLLSTAFNMLTCDDDPEKTREKAAKRPDIVKKTPKQFSI